MSLLDLLHPMEFFVPFDQTTLWRRHVAWAKPKGKEIRDYVVQRFSSNMVFLSLLLGTNMATLMNSSRVATEIREATMGELYYSLKFYIGVIMALASCVTIVGLVATYTSWSMISAVSDTNANTVLRSSMGQYVTALPSRFVVASLYLFLLWLMLLLIVIISGPLVLVLLSVTLFLFFQVVISLSAFGRLVAHTGAMSNKRILDPELERQLLPSGLHASLLIKATERSRRRTSVTEQYRPSPLVNPNSGASENSSQGVKSFSTSTGNTLSPREHPLRRAVSENKESSGGTSESTLTATSSRDRTLFTTAPSSLNQITSPPRIPRKQSDSEEDRAVENAARVFGGLVGSASLPFNENTSVPEQHQQTRHKRLNSTDSVDSVDDLVGQIAFPRASFLNRTQTNQLKNLVNDTLSSRGRTELVDLANEISEELAREDAANQCRLSLLEDDTPRSALRKLASRRSMMVSNDSTRLREEWDEEDDVRNVYDIEPPVEFLSNQEGGYEADKARPRMIDGPFRGLLHLGDSFRRISGSRRFSGTPALNRIQEALSSESLDQTDTSSIPVRSGSEQNHVASRIPYNGDSDERQHLLA